MSDKPWALIDAGECKYGGWLSFTGHLCHALRQQQTKSIVARLGARASLQPKPYAEGLTCIRTTAAHVRASMAEEVRVLITCTSKRMAPVVAKLAVAGIPVVIHDPNDAKWLLDALQRRPARGTLVVIRQAMLRWITGQGYTGQVVYLPHPYVPTPLPPARSYPHHAVTLCRLDWDKHIDDVLAANTQLPHALRIHLYGAENRMYAHHKLDTTYTCWRQQYHGPFDTTRGAAVRLARQAHYVVDASRIKQGDGGGTQYTHLEAWDAEAALVVHEDWIQPDGELQPGINCLTYGPNMPLSQVLQGTVPAKVVRGGTAALRQHAPAVVCPVLHSLREVA